MPELPLEIVIFLLVAAFAAGFMDSIAGGGGLIVMPALLLSGFTPLEALGTNKLQALFGSGSATLSYAARGHVDPRAQLPAAGASLLGSVAGALLATVLPGEWLHALLPVLLVAIALYFLIKPAPDNVDRRERMTPFLFGLAIVPLIGFYDGVFGPGTGSFFMLAFVALAGYGLLKATAHTKLLNFASNVGSLVVFAFAGAIVWKIGLMMGLVQFAGARLGAALAMKQGARFIRPLLVVTCLLMAGRLLMDGDHPLWLLFG